MEEGEEGEEEEEVEVPREEVMATGGGESDGRTLTLFARGDGTDGGAPVPRFTLRFSGRRAGGALGTLSGVKA